LLGVAGKLVTWSELVVSVATGRPSKAGTVFWKKSFFGCPCSIGTERALAFADWYGRGVVVETVGQAVADGDYDQCQDS